MSVKLVQSKLGVHSSGTSFTVVLDAVPKAGNFLVLEFGTGGSNGVSSVTGNGTWVLSKVQSSAPNEVSIYHLYNNTGATATITVNLAGTPSGGTTSARVFEYANMPAAGAVQGSTGTSANNAFPQAGLITSTTPTLSLVTAYHTDGALQSGPATANSAVLPLTAANGTGTHLGAWMGLDAPYSETIAWVTASASNYVGATATWPYSSVLDATSVGDASVTSLSLPRPVGGLNTLRLVVLYTESLTLTPSLSPGSWTKITGAGGQAPAAGVPFETHVYRNRDAGETGPISITWGGAAVWATAHGVSISDRLRVGDPQDIAATFTLAGVAGKAATLPAITPIHDGSVLFSYQANSTGAVSTWSDGSTKRGDVGGVAIADLWQPTAATKSGTVGITVSTIWVTGQVTLRQVDTALEQSAYRFRNDDGSETSATWKAALNTVPNLTPDQTVRLRTQVNGTFDPKRTTFKLQYRKVGAAAWRDLG